jgi:hypothetical protein
MDLKKIENRGNDGFKKNQKPGIFKIVLNSGPPSEKTCFQII